jgi:hypothetical protein
VGILFEDRCRIIEDDRGQFFPQFKCGLFGRWRFFETDSLMDCPDPAMAARFQTEQEARNFIAAMYARADDYWRERGEAVQRQARGISAVRKINLSR